MKVLRQIAVSILLMLMAGMMLHNIIPHTHHSHDHHEHNHASIPDHSHDDQSEEHGDLSLLSLFFAHHSHAVDVPNDRFVLADQHLLDGFAQALAIVEDFHWSPSRDGPSIGLVSKRPSHYSGVHATQRSLRAPPALG